MTPYTTRVCYAFYITHTCTFCYVGNHWQYYFWQQWYCVLDRATQLENYSFMFVCLVIVYVQLYLSFSAREYESIKL